MKRLGFSATRFSKELGCGTYGYLSGAFPDGLRSLLDHGFIVDRACVWDKRLEGHEMAIVARTYCDDDAIDNPPAGLRCVRLDDSVLGGDPGTAVAVVIVGKSAASESILTACTHIPADMFAYMIPLDMQNDGYCVVMKTGLILNKPIARLIKLSDDFFIKVTPAPVVHPRKSHVTH